MVKFTYHSYCKSILFLSKFVPVCLTKVDYITQTLPFHVHVYLLSYCHRQILISSKATSQFLYLNIGYQLTIRFDNLLKTQV